MSDIFIVILIAVVITSLIVIWLVRAGNKEMDRKAHESGAISVYSALHIEGLGLPSKVPCDLYLFTDKLLMDSGERKFEIPLSRIQTATYQSELELREKSKSIVGRALLGFLLASGPGAIVGGMTGMGTKTVKGKPNYFLIIHFTTIDHELFEISFLNNANIRRGYSFCAQLNDQISILQPDQPKVVTL